MDGIAMMRSSLLGAVLLLGVSAAAAQAPAEDARKREEAIQQRQHQAGAAFRELQQAQYEAKLADQDFLNAQDAHAAAQTQVDGRKRQLDDAKKALDAARAKVAQARKRYDEALSGVDQAFQKPPAK
jgi:predicted  nucleic acid-binding Zn-ribbon protein